MRKPFLFLDFDGVLNSDSTSTMITFHTGLDPELVERLNRILDVVDVDVIISSTWRMRYSLDEMKEFLKNEGFRYDSSVKDTTMIDHDYSDYDLDRAQDLTERSFEIKRFLQESCEQNQMFVILDDVITNFKDNQVLTCEALGLQDSDVDRAIDILKRGKGWIKN